MKKNRILINSACVAVFAFAAASTAMANVLLNSGFESDTPPTLSAWTPNYGGGGTIQTTTAYAQSGTKSLLIDSTGAGQWWSPNVQQTFAASAGQEWNMKGYMLTASIPNASFGLFKIVFQNAANVDLLPASASIGGINNAFPGVESTPFLNSGSAQNTWLFSEAQGIAPVGTDHVVLFALNVNQNPSVMYFDNISASVVVVPEPSTFALAGLALASLVTFRRRK